MRSRKERYRDNSLTRKSSKPFVDLTFSWFDAISKRQSSIKWYGITEGNIYVRYTRVGLFNNLFFMFDIKTFTLGFHKLGCPWCFGTFSQWSVTIAVCISFFIGIDDNFLSKWDRFCLRVCFQDHSLFLIVSIRLRPSARNVGGLSWGRLPLVAIDRFV